MFFFFERILFTDRLAWVEDRGELMYGRHLLINVNGVGWSGERGVMNQWRTYGDAESDREKRGANKSELNARLTGRKN